jgi:hypothetical protein
MRSILCLETPRLMHQTSPAASDGHQIKSCPPYATCPAHALDKNLLETQAAAKAAEEGPAAVDPTTNTTSTAADAGATPVSSGTADPSSSSSSYCNLGAASGAARGKVELSLLSEQTASSPSCSAAALGGKGLTVAPSAASSSITAADLLPGNGAPADLPYSSKCSMQTSAAEPPLEPGRPTGALEGRAHSPAVVSPGGGSAPQGNRPEHSAKSRIATGADLVVSCTQVDGKYGLQQA